MLGGLTPRTVKRLAALGLFGQRILPGRFEPPKGMAENYRFLPGLSLQAKPRILAVGLFSGLATRLSVRLLCVPRRDPRSK